VVGSGATVSEAEVDHHQNLLALLHRCRQKGIKHNEKKLCLKCQDTTYMGHELTMNGVRPDPRKVDAILKMPPPEDKPAVRRLLGMATYLSRYCANFSELTAPLRELLLRDNAFIWTDRQVEAFDGLRNMLSSAPVLQYYDIKKPVTLQCDASQHGIGCVLLQDGKPVEYTSRAMTETEQQYAQIEKELLAIVHGFEKFHSYLLLRLQLYTYNLTYQPGSQLVIADTLSRAYPPEPAVKTQFQEDIAALGEVEQEQLRELHMVASADTLNLIQNAAITDVDYQLLIDQIKSGWPETQEELPVTLKPYHTFVDELSMCGGYVFKGHRLVIPQPAREVVLERLHRAHIGVNGILRRARKVTFYPGITTDIKRAAERCEICARHREETQKDPLLPHQPPHRPWEKVGVDVFTFKDIDYLITVDYLSGFFEVDRLPTKSAKDIIYCLQQHFSRHGLPLEVCTDNSPLVQESLRCLLNDTIFCTSPAR